MTIFAVLLFQSEQEPDGNNPIPHVIDRLYNLDPLDHDPNSDQNVLAPCQIIPQTLYLIESDQEARTIATELGLVDNTPSTIPGAQGIVWRLTEPHIGRVPHYLIEWVRNAESMQTGR